MAARSCFCSAERVRGKCGSLRRLGSAEETSDAVKSPRRRRPRAHRCGGRLARFSACRADSRSGGPIEGIGEQAPRFAPPSKLTAGKRPPRGHRNTRPDDSDRSNGPFSELFVRRSRPGRRGGRPRRLAATCRDGDGARPRTIHARTTLLGHAEGSSASLRGRFAVHPSSAAVRAALHASCSPRRCVCRSPRSRCRSTCGSSRVRRLGAGRTPRRGALLRASGHVAGPDP